MFRLAVLVSFVVAASHVHAASPMRPGLWEMTGRMQMEGMKGDMPPFTIKHCVTPKDAEAAETGKLPGADKKGMENCKVSDYKLSGNKASWNITCTGQHAMTGTGTMVFSGDTYTQKSVMKTQRGTMTLENTGKRLGDCPPQ